MACLGSVLYDPATAATASTATAIAMTAFDTTNARITFTAPANGIVLVKIRAAHKGASTMPSVMLGVLDGATVRGRLAPLIIPRPPSTAHLRVFESVFLVTGLTPGVSYTLDAAYGVETVIAATQFGWGGPNNTTASDAYGALSFEVWETANLLAGVNYDPAVAATKATSALLAMTALDTTNLRHVFTVPASGRVLVRLAGIVTGGTTTPALHLGVLEGATVKMRQAAWVAFGPSAPAVTDYYGVEACAVVGGLTPGASLTWDAAYAVETIAATSALRYGGPNTAAVDAFGGFVFEIWEA